MQDVDWRDFRDELQDLAKDLKVLPTEVRKALGREVKPRVAVPLAEKIKATYTGPWVRALQAGTKTGGGAGGADPTIVIGGATKRLSRGGSTRDVVFGSQWGRRGVQRQVFFKVFGRRSKAYTRRTTAHFPPHRNETIYPTIANQYDTVLNQFADIYEQAFREQGF